VSLLTKSDGSKYKTDTKHRRAGALRKRVGNCELMVKIEFTLEQAMKAQRGTRSIDILFL
jgi:hypothetical protein